MLSFFKNIVGQIQVAQHVSECLPLQHSILTFHRLGVRTATKKDVLFQLHILLYFCWHHVGKHSTKGSKVGWPSFLQWILLSHQRLNAVTSMVLFGKQRLKKPPWSQYHAQKHETYVVAWCNLGGGVTKVAKINLQTILKDTVGPYFISSVSHLSPGTPYSRDRCRQVEDIEKNVLQKT